MILFVGLAVLIILAMGALIHHGVAGAIDRQNRGIVLKGRHQVRQGEHSVRK